jgi:hypothetical protein
MYPHPAMSQYLIEARRAEERRQAARHRPMRSQSRAVPARRSARKRAGPFLRWRLRFS